jgi:hypothetical protein
VAAWSNAEKTLSRSSADVVAILDCCHAGIVCQTRGIYGKFEYLGACPEEERTAGPGDSSFTHALIWALKGLKDGPPFTLQSLCLKIKTCEDFPKKQQPIFADPFNRGNGYATLFPMDREFSSEVQNSRMDTLDLRFHYSRDLNDKRLEVLAQKLNEVIAQEDLPISHVGFLEKNKQPELNELALWWRQKAAEGRHSKRANLAIEKGLWRGQKFLVLPLWLSICILATMGFVLFATLSNGKFMALPYDSVISFRKYTRNQSRLLAAKQEL